MRQRVKIGSCSVDVYETDVEKFIEGIRECAENFRKEGATDVQLDWDMRDWSDHYQLYIDAFREETAEEETARLKKAEQDRLRQIEYLNRQLERLQKQ